MSISNEQRKITIVGGGMSGSLMAIFLARRGFDVEIYERRPDIRCNEAERGRSVNLTLAKRGLNVLEEVGVDRDKLMGLTVPLKGRMIHTAKGRLKYSPYGQREDEVIYAVMRNDLNILLMNLAETYPNVKYFFRRRCTGLDKRAGTVDFLNEETGERFQLRSELIIGADGTFSTVRQHMQRGVRSNFKQDFLESGYKELKIPAAPDGSCLLDRNVLHVWPRGDYMLLAMANVDNSLTCTCILPFHGETSLDSLKHKPDVKELFETYFADALPLCPSLVDDFVSGQPASFLTTSTSHWYYEDRIVLLGDAVHTVTPFYGQGMNAAFEDCSVLNQCIDRHPNDWQAVFAEYQSLRKRHTDVLGELSVKNFVELRDKVRLPIVAAHKKIDFIMHRLFPNKWVPLYTMISHTAMPYADAVEKARRQDRVLRWLGVDALFKVASACISVGLRANKRRAARGVAAREKELYLARRDSSTVKGGGY
jgi:kynurenine 3-monooxygenase